MINRWDIITIGNLSRNRYWGEKETQSYRPAICTCTLIQLDGVRLLVDPSLKEESDMNAELFRRTGLKPEAIDAVFLTHAHGDHHYGLPHFPAARWLAAAPVAAQLTAIYDKTVETVTDRLLGEIDVIHTPGHTEHHYSLRFDWAGKSVVLAADAVVTREYWDERRGYFNSTDFAAAAASMNRLAKIADIIIPGHDNYFYVLSAL